MLVKTWRNWDFTHRWRERKLAQPSRKWLAVYQNGVTTESSNFPHREIRNKKNLPMPQQQHLQLPGVETTDMSVRCWLLTEADAQRGASLGNGKKQSTARATSPRGAGTRMPGEPLGREPTRCRRPGASSSGVNPKRGKAGLGEEGWGVRGRNAKTATIQSFSLAC